MIPFHLPVGEIGDVQLHPHNLLPDHLVLQVFWTNKDMELVEGHLELLEYHGDHPQEMTLLLSPEDVTRLRNLFQSIPA